MTDSGMAFLLAAILGGVYVFRGKYRSRNWRKYWDRIQALKHEPSKKTSLENIRNNGKHPAE